MDYPTQSRRATGPGVPTVSLFTTTQTFRYLWLKYVTGFDLSVHCARCLVGKYSTHFSKGKTRIVGARLNEATARFYYICGVTEPYRWKDNLHLVFRYKPGAVIQYDDGKTGIVIEDAEQIVIRKLPDYHCEPHGTDRAYHTCRNWRFAYQTVHEDDVPPGLWP